MNQNFNTKSREVITFVENTQETLINPISFVDNAKKTLINPISFVDNAKKTLIDPISFVDNAKKTLIDPISFVDNNQKTLIDPISFVDNAKKTLIDPVSFVDNNQKTLIDPISFVDKAQEPLNIAFNPITKLKDNTLNLNKKNLCSNSNAKNKKMISKKYSSCTLLIDPISTNVTYKTPTTTFFYDDKTLYAKAINLNTKTAIIKVCNFTANPLALLIEDDGKYQTTFYEINFSTKYSSKTLNLTMKNLNSMNDLLKILGPEFVFSEEKDAFSYFQQYLSELFPAVDKKYIYSHIGWRKYNSRWIYLHGAGAIGCTDKNIRSSLNKSLKLNTSISRQDTENKTLEMLKISNNLSKVLPLFLYSHLAIMKTIFLEAKVEPKFLLWIYGKTNSLKTSVSKVFFDIFNEERIAASFKDTQTGLEPKIYEYKDCVLLLDDYHPSSNANEKRTMESTAQFITRLYGDNIAKSRATKYMGKAKEYPPRGLCAVTGEDIISGQSSLSRILSLEVCTNDYDGQVLSFFQNNPEYYTNHLYFFIEWISANSDHIISFISKQFGLLRNQYSNTKIIKRYSEMYSVLEITVNILIQYFVSCGLTLNFKFLKQEWCNSLKDMIVQQNDFLIQDDPVSMYCFAVISGIQSNKYLLEPLTSNLTREQNIIGYQDENYLYLYPNIAYQCAKDFWKHQGKVFDISTKSLNKNLASAKLITPYNEGVKLRFTLKIPETNSNFRFLKIVKHKFFEIIDSLEI